MTDVKDLFAALHTYDEDISTFDQRRELSERVLLATGWTHQPDPCHPAGEKWQFGAGTNCIVTVWDAQVPNPIQSIDAAMGQIPFGWNITAMTYSKRRDEWLVEVLTDRLARAAIHKSLPVAISIAAIKAWAEVS